MNLSRATCCAALLLGATLSAARVGPTVDFTGTWVLDASTVQTAGPLVLKVVHSGGHLRIVREVGEESSLVLEGPLDGSAVLTWTGPPFPLTDARPAWVGTDLVVAGKAAMPNGVVVQAQRTLALIAPDALRITEVLDTGTTQFTRTETFSRQRP